MRYLVITLSVLMIACSSCNKKYPIDPLPKDTAPPTFSYPVVSFSSTSVFTPFGGTLSSGGTSKGYTVHLTDPNLTVNAVCSGIVKTVTSNSITVLYKANSIYSLYYSGLQNIRVVANDTVRAGIILGKIGNNGEIFFQIIKNDSEAICPDTFSDTGFKAAVQTAITKHIQFYPADSLMIPCAVASLPL
jgi:hypothetical protein